MRPARVIALVIGTLLAIPAIALLLGGASLGMAHAFGREDGYFEVTLDRLETETAAVTAEDIDLMTNPGTPGWLIDALDTDVRLRVTGAESDRTIFVGIGPEADVDAYLGGVAHAEIADIDDDLSATYRVRTGQAAVSPPSDQTFWVASASGVGTQQMLWEAADGRWAVVVMNADGSPGVAVDADVGVDAGFVLPLALTLLGIGAVLLVVAVILIVAGAGGSVHGAAAGAPSAVPSPSPSDDHEEVQPPPSPVSLDARLDTELSRWKWLVKWLLVIPHIIVLLFLWLAFSVLTVVAGFSILFTGRYPSGIFDFNVGVMRWSWRVAYYAGSGGLGTDQYPPFSLNEVPGYPANLTVDYPGPLSRGLVLIKWWLLAIPHYLIVGLLIGNIGWQGSDGFGAVGGGSLLGLLALIAGVILLFTGAYPRPLFGLIVGLNRWVARVIAYAALMTDEYPPFRLDQGGTEPWPGPPPAPQSTGPASEELTEVDLRELSQNPVTSEGNDLAANSQET